MSTNCAQLKEFETVQVLDGKRISFSIPDSMPEVGLFVTYRTETILITIVTSSPSQINSFRIV